MPKKYSRQFRKMVAELICVQHEGTIKTAEEFAQQHKAMHSNSNAKKSAKRPFNNNNKKKN